MSTEHPDPKCERRVSKPLMEKRRRDRINHSLETLRVLLLENTRNEKLRNPKVGKAEILESVVHFLKAEREKEDMPQLRVGLKRGHSEDREGDAWLPCAQPQDYNNGMKTCLLRVSHFIATKSRELEDGTESRGNSLPESSPEQSISPFPPMLSTGYTHVCGETGTPALAPSSGRSPPPKRSLPQAWPDPAFTTQIPRRTDPCAASPLVTENSNRTMLAPKSDVALTDAVWRPWPQ